jgi:uncharacterized protein YndB with AHSA1/START domain
MTDRIEKQIILKAARSKVWQTLTDSKKFSSWFGVEVQGPFVAGATVIGVSLHPGYEGRFEMHIEDVVPESRFSWRWHPGSPAKDYSAEPTTLVAFDLTGTPEGTLLRVVETGFDSLPAERRASAYKDNENGWAIQMKQIAQYVDESH